MRLVVDTNVFVSAALKESSWPAFVIRWLAANGGLLKTLQTEQEVFAVLKRPRIAEIVLPEFAEGIRPIFAAAELVTTTERVRVCRDPKDDKFLELAVNGRADVIVSGDADLLVLEVFRDIPILTPALFARAHLR
jgi:putative PIN family toxin of toxin-antitoxin system